METLKVLAQSFPTAAILTDAYVVPVGASAVLSTILCCNQALTATTVRVAVAVAGAADASKQYLYYDLAVLGKSSFAATLGVTLAAIDVLRVYSVNGNVSFNVFGAEES